MKRTIIFATSLYVGMSLLSTQAVAQDASPTYSGDLLNRSTLTGDWGGARNEMAAKGVTTDLSLTQIGQDVADGGKNNTWEYGGRGNLTVNVDTQKLGWWPGGFMTLEVEGNFSRGVNTFTGALMPVNTNQTFPVANGGDNLNVSALTFMQFLSPHAGVFFGSLDTTSGDDNEFAHGKGDIQFMNTALSFNPVFLLVAPSTTLGAGVVILPTAGDPKPSIITFSVIQTNGSAKNSGFNDLGTNKLTFGPEGRVRTDFFGMTGHQLAGALYSNKTFNSLDQSLRFLPVNRTIEEKHRSWNVYYNFDQYFYEPNKGSGQGIGLFGRLGASDGDPNPMHYFYSFGVGGKGMFPGRPNDRFGIGYYHINVSNFNITGVRNDPRVLPILNISLLRNEYGFEAFYNFAITPWMLLTPDVQLVRPAQGKQLVSGGGLLGLPSLQDVNTAAVIGIRLQTLF